MLESSVDNVRSLFRLMRLANKMTLKDVATKAGISSSYLSKIENNERTPDYSMLLNISHALDASFEEIVLATYISNDIPESCWKDNFEYLKELVDELILKIKERNHVTLRSLNET